MRAVFLALAIFLPTVALGGESEEENLFAAQCGACHGSQGEGIPGFAPPFAGRELVRARKQILDTVLHGLTGVIKVGEETYDGVMPPFAALSDSEVAALVDYVVRLGAPARVSKTPRTTPAEVADARKLTLTAAQLRARRSTEFSDAPAPN